MLHRLRTSGRRLLAAVPSSTTTLLDLLGAGLFVVGVCLRFGLAMALMVAGVAVLAMSWQRTRGGAA